MVVAVAAEKSVAEVAVGKTVAEEEAARGRAQASAWPLAMASAMQLGLALQRVSELQLASE